MGCACLSGSLNLTLVVNAMLLSGITTPVVPRPQSKYTGISQAASCRPTPSEGRREWRLVPNQQTGELILLVTNITGCFTLGVAGDKIVRGQIGKGVMEVCSDGDLGVTTL